MSDSEHLKSKRQRDFDDLQNELACRDVGRQRRFLSQGKASSAERRRRDDRVFRNALDRLLALDPEYRDLYLTLGRHLRDAEQHADARLLQFEASIDRIDAEIEGMQSRAAILPGVGRVYRYSGGRVVSEQGDEIDPVIAAGVLWPANAPSAEDYFGAMHERDALQRQLAEWRAYRIGTLGATRDRYEDRDDPMQEDDMREALQDIEASMPSDVALASGAAVVGRPVSALSNGGFPKFGD